MTKTFRVLHLIEDLGSGGSERLLYTNLSRLDRQRFDGIVVYLYDRNEFWNEPIRQLGYPVVCLRLRSIYGLPLGLIRLLRLLKREPVDLIHTHLFGANLLGRIAGRLHRIPVLSSLHCPDYEPVLLQDNPKLTKTKLAALRILDLLSCRFADPEFLAVSKYVKQSAVQYLGIQPDRITTIYNSIDLKTFELREERHAVLREELGLAPCSPIVLCVARFNPLKGVKYLIEAVLLVKARFPDVCVLLVGAATPEVRQSHMALAEELGVAPQIRFLGIQSDIRPYLRLCDVFVLPSLAEGLGIALVEAMAMKRACVATRVAALPEVVSEGRSGLLVNPADPPGLAAAICRLLDHPSLRAQMGEEGHRIVLERFDVDRTIGELESLYFRLSSIR